MARNKDTAFRISPKPSDRLRYHVDVIGNARNWLALVAQQDDAALERMMQDIDPREDVYVVSLSQAPNGALTQTSHAMHLGQALLRFGDERLCQAWLLPSLQTPYDKAQLMGEALKLQRYDWFSRVCEAITPQDHAKLEETGYDHGPLFYWATTPPPAGSETAYDEALEQLMRLPPYKNRRKDVIDGLERAYDTALDAQNIVALDRLTARGWVPTISHVRRAVEHVAPASLEWLLRAGGSPLVEQVCASFLLPDDGKAWAEALCKAGEMEDPGTEDFDRVAALMRHLAQTPGVGALLVPRLMAKESGSRWEIECQAALLAAQSPQPTHPSRTLRM